MKILIETHHPSDIHFWKYVVQKLKKRGYTVLLISRDRDVMCKLLEVYDWIPYKIISAMRSNNRIPLLELFVRQVKVAWEIFHFKPDIVLSLFGSYAQSARLFGKPNLIFTDSEFQHFNHRIAHPFADAVYTPKSFWKDLGPKHRKYAGNHELAFIRPPYFSPRESVCEQLGCEKYQYLIVRLSAWNTLHDIGQSGVGELAYDFVQHWKERYKIFIVPEEGKCDPRLTEFVFKLPPDWFHDALYYARLVLTEGASTASEAACMGTPTVYINSTEHRGYLDELEEEYGLVHSFAEPEPGLKKADELLSNDLETLQRSREAKTAKLYDETIDVPEFVVQVIEQTIPPQS